MTRDRRQGPGPGTARAQLRGLCSGDRKGPAGAGLCSLELSWGGGRGAASQGLLPLSEGQTPLRVLGSAGGRSQEGDCGRLWWGRQLVGGTEGELFTPAFLSCLGCLIAPLPPAPRPPPPTHTLTCAVRAAGSCCRGPTSPSGPQRNSARGSVGIWLVQFEVHGSLKRTRLDLIAICNF